MKPLITIEKDEVVYALLPRGKYFVIKRGDEIILYCVSYEIARAHLL